MKKLISALAAAVLFATLLAGCGSTSGFFLCQCFFGSCQQHGF